MATTGEPFGLFWDSESGDRTYSAASFEYWLKKFFTSGVFNGDLQVKASSGMTLEIEPGYANVDGKVKFWNGAFTLTLNAANSTYPRIDTIVITRDNVNRQIVCEVVTGSYSGDTPQPTAPVRNSEIYQLVLAQIYVGAGVTGITQANITDTRPDNTLCGWITGTVEELDFSQFTAQFEQYFREFKADAEGDYESWFNEVQSEQIEDKEAWDAWYAALQEELHNLPADSAEYLQIQIDELKESGLSGSIFKITTINPSLEGKTVRIINADNTEEKTGTFDSNLECVIYGMKSVGEITITSTDGIQTATSVISIPYFGNYTVPIAFWAATVNMQGDTNLYGATITIKDSDNLTVGTVVLSAVDGTGTFTASKADTYTFNYTYQGTSYSQELVVSEETTYSISLSAGFSWVVWVDTASQLDSTDYESLDEVLADEKALRELFLEHACVDYMAESTVSNADLETIINDDYCAKWINNSDYALDFLGANAVIKALMDEVDKYGYGEWVITDDSTTPPTWGAKGNVPVMTANNAPYGTAGATTTYSSTYDAFYAFNGVVGENTTSWSAGSTANAILYYKFTNPINVRKFLMYPEYTNQGQGYDGASTKTWDIVASNDGSTWETLYSGENENSYNAVTDVIENDDYYLYYGIRVKTSYRSNSYSVSVLQFYGRELKVSVPKMTSNTAPYGEASSDSVLASTYSAWKAFDGTNTNQDDCWHSAANGCPCYIRYDFGKAVSIKEIVLTNRNYNPPTPVTEFTLQGSNDGVTFTDIEDYVNTTLSSASVSVYSVSQDVEYRYLQLYITQGTVLAGDGKEYAVIGTLQFYGLDYSEKEFEVGTTKKWLYDHGVELETMSLFGISATNWQGSTITKNDSFIEVKSGNVSAATAGVASPKVNLSSYDLIRAKICGAILVNTNAQVGLTINDQYDSSIDAWSTYQSGNGNLPNNLALDVSSVNTEDYVILYVPYGVNSAPGTPLVADLSELWLE